MELFVAERAFAGVFPTHGGQACIWVCTPSDDAKEARRRAGRAGLRRLLRRSAPSLPSGAPRPTDLAGAGHAAPANQARRAVGRMALVGDAGYYRDTVTAHGISDAFRDAGCWPPHWTRR
jgi:flavin-dependent dehydrogenase